MNTKNFLEFIKRIGEEKKERKHKEKNVYEETFKEDGSILDFLRIAEEESLTKDERKGIINYLEMYTQFGERQVKISREDLLKASKKKVTKN